MVIDPVSDMINRIKMAQARGKESVSIPYSAFKFEIAKVMEKERFIKAIDRKGKKVHKTLVLELAYNEDSTPRVSGAERISKPSRRIYKGAKELQTKSHLVGHVFVSTPGGILTKKQAAKSNVGGEILFRIW